MMGGVYGVVNIHMKPLLYGCIGGALNPRVMCEFLSYFTKRATGLYGISTTLVEVSRYA